MLSRISFANMTPDQSGENVELAINVLPDPNGYGPVKSLMQFTPPLNNFLGGAAFNSPSNETAFLAGNNTDLFRYDGLAWNSVISRAANIWRFGQFGDNIICVNGNELITFNITSGLTELTPDNPPASDLITIIRDFVVVAGDPMRRNVVTWSGFNNSSIWTAGTQQSGAQEILVGGEITGLAGGEYGIVFQRNSINRMNFVGDEIVFTFDKISENIGCMAKGSVAQAGRLIFFLSERGFYVTEGNDATPIGVEQVDAEFFRLYAREDIENIRSAVDPSRHIVFWAMRGRIWAYNWIVQKWSVIDMPNIDIISGFNANIGADAVSSVFNSDLDSLGFSLDSDILAGGNPLLLVARPNGSLNTLSGANMAASLFLAPTELDNGVTKINGLRLISDASDCSITMRGALYQGGNEIIKTTSEIRRNGDLPIRMRAQSYKINVNIPAAINWSYLKGLEFRYESGGRR